MECGPHQGVPVENPSSVLKNGKMDKMEVRKLSCDATRPNAAFFASHLNYKSKSAVILLSYAMQRVIKAYYFIY